MPRRWSTPSTAPRAPRGGARRQGARGSLPRRRRFGAHARRRQRARCATCSRSASTSICRNDDTAQRAAVDIAAQWRRYARELQAAGAAVRRRCRRRRPAPGGGAPRRVLCAHAGAHGRRRRAGAAGRRTAPRVVAVLSRLKTSGRGAGGAGAARARRVAQGRDARARRCTRPAARRASRGRRAWISTRCPRSALARATLALAEQLDLGGDGPPTTSTPCSTYCVGAALGQRPTGDSLASTRRRGAPSPLAARSPRARASDAARSCGRGAARDDLVPAWRPEAERCAGGAPPARARLTTARGGGGVRVSVQLAPEKTRRRNGK